MRTLIYVVATASALQLHSPPAPEHALTTGNAATAENAVAKRGFGDYDASGQVHKVTDPMKELAKMKMTVDRQKQKSALAQKADPLTDAMFDPVIDQIRTIVRSNIKEALAAVTNTIANHVQEMITCAANHGFDSVSGTSYTPADTDLTQKKKTAKDDCETAETAKDSRDNAGKTLYETVKNSVGCSQTADVEDVPMDALNFPLANVDVFAQTVVSQHTDWQNAAQAAATAETKCTQGEQAKTEACAKVQQLADAGKSAYDKCYNQAKGSYDVAVGQLVSTEPSSPSTAMKSQIENVESLICYIKVAIHDGTASKFNCKQMGMMLVCDCVDGDNVMYEDIEYDFAANPDLAVEKNRKWNDKGCTALASVDEECALATDCESGACEHGKCVALEEGPPACVESQVGECNQNGKGDCCSGMQCTAWNGRNAETGVPDSTKICIDKDVLENGFYR
jgi:hypothetical protein